MKKIKQIAIKILVIIVTGAIGSAFWEFWIRDGILRFSRWTVEVVSLFSEKSIDFIYENPHQGDTIFISMPSILLVYGSIFFFIYVYIIQRRQLRKIERYVAAESAQVNNETSEQNADEKSTKDRKLEIFANYIIKGYPWIMKIYISLYSIIILVVFSTSAIKYGIKRTTEQNLQIVKPYIPETEFDLLYSEYLQVTSKSDFLTLQNKLDKIANPYKIKLNNPIE